MGSTTRKSKRGSEESRDIYSPISGSIPLPKATALTSASHCHSYSISRVLLCPLCLWMVNSSCFLLAPRTFTIPTGFPKSCPYLDKSAYLKFPLITLSMQKPESMWVRFCDSKEICDSKEVKKVLRERYIQGDVNLRGRYAIHNSADFIEECSSQNANPIKLFPCLNPSVASHCS